MKKKERFAKLEKEEELRNNFWEKFKARTYQQKQEKKKRKRKLTYLDMPDFSEYDEFQVFQLEFNDKEDFKAKSYNQDKQIIEYVSFVYFKYEAPLFLVKGLIDIYEEANKKTRRPSTPFMDRNTQIPNVSFFELYHVVATGGSVRKLLKDYLNKKEVHFFLQSKQEHISKAFVEAKMKYLNYSDDLIDFFLSKRFIVGDYDLIRLNKVLQFFSKNLDKLTRNEISEILDFFYLGLDHNINLEHFFSRSFENIKRASEDWHIEQIFIKKIRKTMWEQTFDVWRHEDARNNEFIVVELNSAKKLSAEGRAMHHCVSSYARLCARGDTAIISLIGNGERMVTCEVDKKKNMIVQVRGKFNRPPSNKELGILYLFAVDNNLEISKYVSH